MTPVRTFRSDEDLAACVLGGAGAELAEAIAALGRLPFADRRALTAEQLARHHRVSRSDALRLVALWELAERWFPDARPRVTTARDAVLLFDRLRGRRRERVEVLLLDARQRPLGIETVAVGGVNASRLVPRDVFAPALRRDAVAVIIGHNHPSGEATPSRADRRVTAALRSAGALLGIDVLDHLILTRTGHFSFREDAGWEAEPVAA